jgi:hypothetical protein
VNALERGEHISVFSVDVLAKIVHLLHRNDSLYETGVLEGLDFYDVLR